jgi:hypothetical protein
MKIKGERKIARNIKVWRATGGSIYNSMSVNSYRLARIQRKTQGERKFFRAGYASSQYAHDVSD